MRDISPLKLTLVLIIIRDSEASEVLKLIASYTNSGIMQVLHILENIESKKFIEFKGGTYNITMDGYSYLKYRNATELNLTNLNNITKINESVLSTYIPKSL